MANMFDENGNYNKTEWKPGDRITAGKLNKIEESLEAINNNDIERHKEADERLDALEEQNEAIVERFDELEDLVADKKSEVEVLIYENNVKMDRLEQEMNDGIDTVEAIAHTVDDKIAEADASMKAQVNQGKADMEAMVAEVEGELDGINTRLEQNAYYITPEMFGGVGDGVVDDYIALQQCLDFDANGKMVVIDLKGKEWYSSKTLNLRTNYMTVQNGAITSLENTFQNEHEYTNNYRFINLILTSINGYVFYIKAFDANAHTNEYYDILYMNCFFKGKLGGYYASSSNIGFSQTFIDVKVSSEQGHGFSGVKGPGTTMIHCINQGIPNGALFHNCFCTIIESDSNRPMKHAVEFSNYYNDTEARFIHCNFEHCTHEGVYCSASGLNINLDACAFTKTYITESEGKVNSDCMYMKAGKKLKMSNVSIKGFNYGDGYYDLRYTGSPYMDVSNETTLKTYNESFYRLNAVILPKRFTGTVNVNQITREGEASYIEKYSQDQINYYASTNFMSMFYIDRSVEVIVDDNILLILTKNTPLSNNFIVKDSTITEIKGVKSAFAEAKIGNGSIISLKNETENNINLTHNHWTGRKFMFKSNNNTTLEPGQTILFIVKNRDFYELI